jgi:hypothetical protein
MRSFIRLRGPKPLVIVAPSPETSPKVGRWAEWADFRASLTAAMA